MGLRRAIATFLCCLTITSAAHAEDPCAEGQLESATVSEGVLTLQWIGTIRYEMDRRIAEKFDAEKDRVVAVMLRLSSCGGSSDTMKRTIDVLQRISRTHILFTMVWRGDTCASACVPIFLQGSRRYAARASLWMFHEASEVGASPADGDTVARITKPALSEEIVRDHAVAGVSKRWLKRMRANIKGAEWWQTGAELWDSKSGIITEVFDNRVPRAKEERQHFSPAVICGAFCRG